jgi:hypothetical protein
MVDVTTVSKAMEILVSYFDFDPHSDKLMLMVPKGDPS